MLMTDHLPQREYQKHGQTKVYMFFFQTGISFTLHDDGLMHDQLLAYMGFLADT